MSRIRKHKPPNPYAYQKIGIFLMRHKHKGRALLADDVGLGKSLQSLHAAIPFRKKHPIIVVCPNAVKYGWEVEVHKHTGLQSMIIEGTKVPDTWPLQKPPVIIINWDILQYWVDWLLKLKPSVIIGDEIHYAKNRNANRTKAFRKLCKNVDCLYFLTGTPIENCPAEFFVPLNILRKDLFPAFRPFGMRYCDPKFTHWGIKYEGATNIEELHKILKQHVMIRRTKKEVLKDLPPLTRVVIPIEIKRADYEEAERDFVRYLYKVNPLKANVVKDMAHLAKLNMLLGLVGRLKTPAVIEWIQNFLESTDKKLTVFGHHREFLETLYDKFKDQSVLVYGGMSGKKRKLAIDSFVGDKKKRIFFGSITATGTGINNLQRVCHDIVIAELIWVGVKLLQVEGRLHRIGQKFPVTAHYLIAQKTVEDTLCRAIHRKQESINQVVDGDYSRQEFDIFKTVLKKITSKRS